MSAPWVLALDTSTVVQVGVAREGEVLARRTVDDRMAHVEQLTPLIAEAVAEAGVALPDLGSIVVGLGPGPFTGLRVGIVSAQVLAAVRGVPVHGVCSLDVLALAYAPRSGTSSSPPTPGAARSTGPATPAPASGSAIRRSPAPTRCPRCR